MRGATAKRLRGMAGVTKESQACREYTEDDKTARTKTFKDLKGKVLGQITTITQVLKPNPRGTYKLLKSIRQLAPHC